MQIPLEISYHGLTKSEAIDQFIRDKATHMERFCDHISRCDIVVEQPNATKQSGSQFRVRIDLTVPPHHELVVDEKPESHDMHEPLQKVINDAFKSMERQLRNLSDKQQGRVKSHDQHTDAEGPAGSAMITKLFPELGYGFITDASGRDVHFTAGAVTGSVHFKDLKVGASVRFDEIPGEQGPTATTVKVLSSGQPHF